MTSKRARAETALRIYAGLQLLLMAASAPLWLGSADFPEVPLLDVLRNSPPWLDTGLLGIFVIAVVWLLLRSDVSVNRFSRLAAATALLANSGLCLLNQHRLQPWNVLFLWFLVTAAILPSPDQRNLRLRVLRIVVATMYVCAALSRFGPELDDAQTQQMLALVLSAVDLQRLLKQPDLVWAICLSINLAELLTGICLLVRPLHRLGLWLAVVLHAMLLLVLGPWGLNHHAGVLIWNAGLLVLIPLLFSGDPIPAASTAATELRLSPSPSGCWRARLLASAGVIFALSGLVGLADNWPAWQVYSPRPEVLRLSVHEDSVADLPEDLQAYLSPPAPLDVWRPVRLDLWSLAAVKAPVYPEDRFQLGLAVAVADYVQSPDQVRAVLDYPQRPVWWQRETLELQNAAEIRSAARQFLLNALPRQP